jgi:hypothetical protein
MHSTPVASLLAAIFSGGAVPIVWVIGIILIVVGVVALFRSQNADWRRADHHRGPAGRAQHTLSGPPVCRLAATWRRQTAASAER